MEGTHRDLGNGRMKKANRKEYEKVKPLENKKLRKRYAKKVCPNLRLLK